jgi:uncharacterized RDD family membrane protein YckC
MKCPKCEYLGFETGDRCRNCGYDFSLMQTADALPDLDLRAPDAHAVESDAWLQRPDTDNSVEAAAGPALRDRQEAPLPPFLATPARKTPSSLPLFTASGDDDAPLVKLPAATRAPLAVRRTPENPRLRNFSKPVARDPEPVLQFEEPAEHDAPLPPPRGVVQAPRTGGASTPLARLLAAAVDYTILGVIDVTVLYFTLKVAAVSSADWQQIPVVPMVAFLVLMKLLYFSAFTAVGGQTIGKMGFGIRVIAEDGAALDPMRAVRRSVALLGTLGAGFLPAVLGDDRRAIHDRVAGTRVVAA